jgi:hypothetical protein
MLSPISFLEVSRLCLALTFESFGVESCFYQGAAKTVIFRNYIQVGPARKILVVML